MLIDKCWFLAGLRNRVALPFLSILHLALGMGKVGSGVSLEPRLGGVLGGSTLLLLPHLGWTT